MSSNGTNSDWFIVINPRSGQGKGSRVWDIVKNSPLLRSISYRWEETKYKGHSRAIVAREIENGCRKFICIGGDGSLHHMLNGLLNSPIPSNEALFLLISAGTGNDFSRNYDLPRGEEALQLINFGKHHLQDCGKVEYFLETPCTTYFHNFIGAGFDALVVKNNHFMKWLGPASYLASIFTSFLVYKNTDCKISFDNESLSDKIYMMLASIGPYCGGGMMLNPFAETDDALFDLFIARDIGKIDIALNASRLYNGEIRKHPKVISKQVSGLSIESQKEVSLEADGELLGNTPAKISLIPKAFKVLIPATS